MLKVIFLFNRGRRYLVENGFIKTLMKVFRFLKGHSRFYNQLQRLVATDEILQEQRKAVFTYSPLISIIVPLFNTPEKYLLEMLDSVCKQSYMNWQLCMTDGSNCTSHIEEIVRQYEKQIPGKIKYKRLEENSGISENTNACIAMSDGDYLAILDHDDVLAPNALFEVVTAIVEKHADLIYTDEATFMGKINNIILVHFKPDFAIDNLRANNYICHFTVFKKSLLSKVGLFRKEYDGSQDHDMVLRLAEVAEHIVHIPKVLYYWRIHKNSVSADINIKSYAIEAGRRAVLDHLRRIGMKAEVESSKASPTIYRIRYELVEKPLISIIILNRNSLEKLQSCIGSIYEKSTYTNYEIIIVDNNSSDEDIFSYYRKIEKQFNVKIIKWDFAFNYSSANNFGAQYANGKYLIFLNNDIRVIEHNWIEEMLMYAQRTDVGAVGAKLYYDNNTIQHGGIILGIGKEHVAGYAHHKFPRYETGYMGRLCYAQDVSAVTAACMMVKKSLYDKLGGFDENFSVIYYDVDFCLRLRKMGYLNVFTPYAELYHSVSESCERKLKQKNLLYIEKEIKLFKERWSKQIMAGDPYYNPNFKLERGDFSLK